jgi:hypothetical protein
VKYEFYNHHYTKCTRAQAPSDFTSTGCDIPDLSLHGHIYSHVVQVRPQTAISSLILTTTVLNFLSQIFMHAEYKITESQFLTILLAFVYVYIKPLLNPAHPHNILLKSRNI